jgi:hypothetical protein
VRCKRCTDQRIIAIDIVQCQPFGQIFIGILRPGARKIDHDQPDAGTHAGGRRGARGHVREEVHVVETRDAATQHFRHGQLRAVMHELGVDPLPFRRPDVLCKPLHQRQVVGQAAQQAHRRMGVCVDQARYHQLIGQFMPGRGLVCRACLYRGQYGENAPLMHGDGMVFEQGIVRYYGGDPAREDQCIDSLHGLFRPELAGQYTVMYLAAGHADRSRCIQDSENKNRGARPRS